MMIYTAQQAPQRRWYTKGGSPRCSGFGRIASARSCKPRWARIQSAQRCRLSVTCAYIRNDLFHNNGTASTECSGKCEILKWFTPGERIVLGTRHVFDFLNQTGVLSLGHAHDDASRSCSFEAYIFDSDGRNRLLQWRPKPKLISVRTQQEGKEADPPYKALTVVFDNGLFANAPCQVPDQRRWEALGDASVHSDSNLVFADGTIINSDQLYRSAVHEHEPRKPGDERPRLPVSGPPIRFRR